MAVLPLDDPSLVFLAAVLLTAVVGGLGPSIFASVLGLLVYDFFFVEPRFTFTVTKPQDLLSLFVFLLVAVLTSNLTSRVRDQAEAARRRERRTAALYAFAREIAAAASVDDLLRVIVEHVGREFGAPAAILLPEGGRLMVRATHPPDVELPEPERGTATWVLEHNQPAGRGTDTLPGGTWLHVPLATIRGAVGVLGLHSDEAADTLSLPQRQLLEAMAGQAAVAIERTRIDAVLEAQAKLEAVIESIEDGLVVVDHDGVVQHVNEVACAILGFEAREAVGQRFERLGTNHPHYLRLRAAVADFLAHPEREHEAVELALFLRGRDHFYVLRPTPLRARDGTHAGFILVLQDVTYLRDQERQREQLMATLSHELRTPLTSLRMAVDLLDKARPALDPERSKLVEAAREDVARLEDVAQRLLDVSRSRAMSIALERQHVHLGDVVARSARIFALQARERGVALDVSVPDVDLRIAGDPTKITWALSNLIANALRYTPRGGQVTLAASADDGVVRVSVADTGPGIAAGAARAHLRALRPGSGRRRARRRRPRARHRARHRAGARRPDLPRQRGRPRQPLHARAAAGLGRGDGNHPRRRRREEHPHAPRRRTCAASGTAWRPRTTARAALALSSIASRPTWCSPTSAWRAWTAWSCCARSGAGGPRRWSC